MHDHGRYRLLGQTVDDAAGEAFDKVGRLLGLPYPGGPAISAAAEGERRRPGFRGRAPAGPYDFSFSGLKTAVLREVAGYRERGERSRSTAWPRRSRRRWSTRWPPRRVAAAVSTASPRWRSAAAWPQPVAAQRAARAARCDGLPLLVPPPAWCTDNGAMIGAAAGVPLPGRGSCRPSAGGDPEPLAGVGRRRDRPARARAPRAAHARAAAPPDGGRAAATAKGLSQNFLTDAAALDAIVAAAELEPGDRVVEVGPGLGVLTRRLLAAGATVIAVELDPRLAAYLRRELGRGARLRADRGRCALAASARLLPRRGRSSWSPTSRTTSPARCSTPSSRASGRRMLTVAARPGGGCRAGCGAPGQMSYLSVFVQNVAERRGRRPRARGGLRARAGGRLCHPAPAPAPEPQVVPVGAAPGAVLPARAGRVPAAAQAAPQRARPRAAGASRETVAAAFAACGIDAERRRPDPQPRAEWACLTGASRAPRAERRD